MHHTTRHEPRKEHPPQHGASDEGHYRKQHHCHNHPLVCTMMPSRLTYTCGTAAHTASANTAMEWQTNARVARVVTVALAPRNLPRLRSVATSSPRKPRTRPVSLVWWVARRAAVAARLQCLCGVVRGVNHQTDDEEGVKRRGGAGDETANQPAPATRHGHRAACCVPSSVATLDSNTLQHIEGFNRGMRHAGAALGWQVFPWAQRAAPPIIQQGPPTKCNRVTFT